MDVETDTNKPKHQGNFEISVSFDLYGDTDEVLTEASMDILQGDIKETFNNWRGRWQKHFKIENVRWNE